MGNGKIISDRDGEIATLSLHAPERMNALDMAMWTELRRAIEELDGDDGVRCIVLRGSGGRAFAAGADIAEFENERNSAVQAKQYAKDMHGSLHAIANCRHPIVAMIEGACVGGGLEIAAVCDMRICGESSRFGVPVKNLGLVVAYNEMRGLVDLVGPGVALEIVLEGRIFHAPEAFAKGLVNRVVPDDEVEKEAYATADRIAEGAPLVAQWHKKFARRLMDPAPLSEAEQAESFACFDTADFQAGFRAFLNKSKPKFTGN
jgi:enoyl-CoA hydratase/carnithine racemase